MTLQFQSVFVGPQQTQPHKKKCVEQHGENPTLIVTFFYTTELCSQEKNSLFRT